MSKKAFVILTALWIAVAGGPLSASAADGPPSAKELAKEYRTLRQQRFYRNASTLLENATRYAQMDESQISPVDRFMRAFFEARWDEVRTTLEKLPQDLSGPVYDKMLDDLAGRTVPILTLDDFLGLAEASPGDLTSERIRKLGHLLRIAVPKEQELWLKRALEKGNGRLGREGAKKLVTGRVLLHADFVELARQYLPTPAEAAQMADPEVQDEVLKFLASQEETAAVEQTRIAKLWKDKAHVLAGPEANQGDKQQAVDRMVELLGRIPPASAEPWIRSLTEDDPAGAVWLASTLGKVAQTKGADPDLVLRTNHLKAQKALVVAAAQHADLAKAPWNVVAIALADWWVREAESTFNDYAGFRSGRPTKPHVAPEDLLVSVPDGPWAKAMPGSLRERIDVCLSRAVLVSDRYEAAVEMIVDLAGRNPKAGQAVAEEYLHAWAYRHNPQIPDDVRKKLQLPEDARIVVTPIMMEKNIASLAKMMESLRSRGVQPSNGALLVSAFDVCYSNAEVYRRSHIEKVFGPIEAMEEDIFLHMVRKMVEGLSSRWRKLEVQKESGTRRTQEATLRMVRDGYQAAIDMIDLRSKKHPDSWRAAMLAGSLLSDWGDFEYYQELAAEAKKRRMETFREKNNLAEEYFTRAAQAYARQVPKLGRGGYSIDLYLAWFHSLLGFNTSGDLNLSKPTDRRALNKIHDLVRALPGDAAQTHIDQFARYVSARLENTEKPLHEDIKYKYLAGSLVITRESPFSLQTNNKVGYYDELLNEIRLETRVDGPNTIHRDREFGILLVVRHTEALGRMADFGKYLVNEASVPYVPPWKQQKLVPIQIVRRLREIRGRRDELEMNLREALSLYFDIKSITFSPRDVQPRPTERPGWKETVLAYVHAKAKDASVDKIPRVQMNLEFLDLTGPVKISAESPETMIKVTDQETPPRPYHRVDMTQVLDARNLAGSEEATLEITASANGLVPELPDLVDLDALAKQLPVARIDPHDGTVVRELNSWADKIHVVSQRRWTVALNASSLLKPPRRIKLELPVPKEPDASVKCQTYADMDLVDLAEPVTVLGPAEGEVAEGPQAAVDWIPYAASGGAVAAVLLAGLAVAWMVRGRGPRPLRARDVFHMPPRVDGFVVVQLLRALGCSDLARLNEAQRVEMRQEIERVQKACFGGNGSGLSEADLRNVVKKWLRIAC